MKVLASNERAARRGVHRTALSPASAGVPVTDLSGRPRTGDAGEPELPADTVATPPLRRSGDLADGALERARAERDARRHATSVLRDVVAAERDRVAEQRDRVASTTDAALLAAHPENEQLQSTLAAHALLREQFNSYRIDAARDRAGAAEERMQAAIDRHEARVARDDAAGAAAAAGTHPGAASGRIATRLVGLHKQYRGRGPETVDVQCFENMVTVVMRDDYSRLERHLSASGHGQSVDDQRSVYETLMKPLLIEATEQELGRTVDAFLSVSHHDPDMTVEIFMLQPR